MGYSENGSGAIDQASACPNLDRDVLSWLGNHTNTASCDVSEGGNLVGVT